MYWKFCGFRRWFVGQCKRLLADFFLKKGFTVVSEMLIFGQFNAFLRNVFNDRVSIRLKHSTKKFICRSLHTCSAMKNLFLGTKLVLTGSSSKGLNRDFLLNRRAYNIPRKYCRPIWRSDGRGWQRASCRQLQYLVTICKRTCIFNSQSKSRRRRIVPFSQDICLHFLCTQPEEYGGLCFMVQKKWNERSFYRLYRWSPSMRGTEIATSSRDFWQALICSVVFALTAIFEWSFVILLSQDFAFKSLDGASILKKVSEQLRKEENIRVFHMFYVSNFYNNPVEN